MACLLQSSPNEVVCWSHSLRRGLSIYWTCCCIWTLPINQKTSQEQSMAAQKCSVQAEPVQPPAPIREARPLHQLNEPRDLHANKGGRGAAFITAEKGSEMLATHGLSLGNCSPRITQYSDLHLAQGINWKLPSPVISNKSQLLIQKALRGSLINLSVKPKQRSYLLVRKEQV